MHAQIDSQIPIFVINLESSKDRLSNITEMLNAYNLKFKRSPAIDGRLLTHDFKKSIVKSHRGKLKLSDGEIGCYLSHLAVYKEIVGSDIKFSLILEDDAFFSPEFSVLLKSGLPFPVDMDILKLEGYRRKTVKYISLFSYNDYRYVFPELVSFGTAGYIITLEGAKKLLKSSKILRQPADHGLFRYWESGVVIYEVHPFPIKQSAFESTIGLERAKSRKKTTGIKGTWRRIKTEISRVKRGIITFLFQLRLFGLRAFNKRPWTEFSQT
jgi:glycosyl transferase family 25